MSLLSVLPSGKLSRTTGGRTVTLDLNSNIGGVLPSADFAYPNGGIFRSTETSVAGTNDVFFQGVPGTTSGFAYLEAFNSAGLALGTGGTGTQIVSMRPNRVETARFTATAFNSIQPIQLNGTVAIDANGLLRARGFTVATLPSASGISGARAQVSDSLAAPVFAATLTGGGAVSAPVYSDGTAWRYG